ncbi:uncharacterized protein LOC129956424 isoform X3 [Argiope bruennichi]|uniref:uncharacterized protein LOC129956424 isoform X3 n=1 Tax=Argiope bruennichi TaxID=94029 RepID=UPI0024954E95|nr:uncharacterized protein LOC129956424 isoform X3 [Argiope bruennichi]
MADERNRLERQELHDEFRIAVHQMMQFVNNERDGGRIRPDDREWRVQRAKTIEKINELIDLLDKTCVAANYGKGLGISAKIAGEIASILAALMKLNESSSAQTLMDIGNFLSRSGYLLEGASNAVESFVSAKYLKEIEEVLKKDQELSRPLQDWLAFSRNLNINVRRIFGCDLNFAMHNNVFKVFSEFLIMQRRCRNFQQTLDNMRSGNFALDIGVNVPIEILQIFSSQIEIHPEFYDNIYTICCTLSNSARVVQIAGEGIAVYRNLIGEESNPETDGNSRSEHAMADSTAPGYPNAFENDGVAGDSSRVERDHEPPSMLRFFKCGSFGIYGMKNHYLSQISFKTNKSL